MSDSLRFQGRGLRVERRQRFEDSTEAAVKGADAMVNFYPRGDGSFDR